LGALIRSYPSLARGGNALDVGANIGYTAELLARAIDPGRVVYAFEPEPFNYRLLQRTADRAEFRGRIVTCQSAIGAEDGSAQLWVNMRHPADHKVITKQFRQEGADVTGITVPMLSIDNFVARNPGPVALIKIDVQGFEQTVCEGMGATLARNPELKIVLEYAPSAMRELGFNPSDLIQLLTRRGLQCYLIGPKGRLSPGVPSGIMDSDYVDLLFSRNPLARG
jgi:FkbM family methyltransferase